MAWSVPPLSVVAAPFPAGERNRERTPSLSVGVREKIVQLRREKKEYKDIATECGVSVDTVRRYLKEAGLTRAYKRKGTAEGGEG